jgi:hypothetical protein
LLLFEGMVLVSDSKWSSPRGRLLDLGLKIEGPLSPVLVNSAGATTEVLGLVSCELGGASDYDVLVNEKFCEITKYLYLAGSGLETTVRFWAYGSAGSLFADAPE